MPSRSARRFLFVCSRNRRRSPTAEVVFGAHPDIECDSAGLKPDADNLLTPELIEWAEVILVMEPRHRAELSRRFRRHLANKRVVCLDIPDKYACMEPALVELLRARAGRFLPRAAGTADSAPSE